MGSELIAGLRDGKGHFHLAGMGPAFREHSATALKPGRENLLSKGTGVVSKINGIEKHDSLLQSVDI